ncbi:MAG: cell division protein FtsZ, partial [Cryomorphaceae bacterium]
MKFDLPKENSSIIKVLGVGGGGSNAVNHMYKQGINGVDFLVCNTDQQALDISPVPLKVQLGATLTEGRGAGSLPEVGKNAATENIEDIKSIISTNTKMVFITAGMGGGTGTGAAPVIAKTAREMGVLTVGIVTMPFFFEGRKRRQQAESGIEEIREHVDTLLIINNEKLREMCGNLPIAQAFAMADNVLATAAKGIAEIITRTGYINVDFEDVRTVMTESGVAIMGSAAAEGEDRAIKAVEKALASPLLNDNNIEGARYVLLNITFGNQEVLMDEISDITDYIQDEAGSSADVIWGYGMDEALGDQLSVTIVATGFHQNPNTGVNLDKKQEKRKMNLEDEAPSKSESTVKKTAPSADEPFLKRPENEVAQVEDDAQDEENTDERKTFFSLTDEVKDADDDSMNLPEPDLSEPKASQRIFEFDMNSGSEESTESKKQSVE